MKRYTHFLLSIVMLFMLQSCMVKSRPNMEFVKRTHLSKNSEVVALNPPMWLAKPIIKSALKDEQDEDTAILKHFFKKLKKFRMMTIANNDKVKSAALLTDYQKFLKKNKFEELLSINSEGQVISLNAKINRDNLIERISLAVNDDEDESIFMDIKGRFSLDELIEGLNKVKFKDKKLNDKF